jgi:hypothetical protein
MTKLTEDRKDALRWRRDVEDYLFGMDRLASDRKKKFLSQLGLAYGEHGEFTPSESYSYWSGFIHAVTGIRFYLRGELEK